MLFKGDENLLQPDEIADYNKDRGTVNKRVNDLTPKTEQKPPAKKTQKKAPIKPTDEQNIRDERNVEEMILEYQPDSLLPSEFDKELTEILDKGKKEIEFKPTTQATYEAKELKNRLTFKTGLKTYHFISEQPQILEYIESVLRLTENRVIGNKYKLQKENIKRNAEIAAKHLIQDSENGQYYINKDKMSEQDVYVEIPNIEISDIDNSAEINELLYKYSTDKKGNIIPIKEIEKGSKFGAPANPALAIKIQNKMMYYKQIRPDNAQVEDGKDEIC